MIFHERVVSQRNATMEDISDSGSTLSQAFALEMEHFHNINRYEWEQAKRMDIICQVHLEFCDRISRLCTGTNTATDERDLLISMSMSVKSIAAFHLTSRLCGINGKATRNKLKTTIRIEVGKERF